MILYWLSPTACVTLNVSCQWQPVLQNGMLQSAEHHHCPSSTTQLHSYLPQHSCWPLEESGAQHASVPGQLKTAGDWLSAFRFIQ